MRQPRQPPESAARILAGLLACALYAGASQASDLLFQSADTVNEGPLHLLQIRPAKPVHHHQNRIRIDANSLADGWVALKQCHDNLDAVPRAQITFREGYIRDLKVEQSRGIEQAWVEGASVQLQQIAPGSRLCLSARMRALRDAGNGFYNLVGGPYMRKFLDGYYPMQVTLDIDYPQTMLRVVDISPQPAPGLALQETPGHIHIDALFEGELFTLVQFVRP